MTPLCADIRLDIYKRRYGALTAIQLREQIRTLTARINDISPFARELKELASKRYGLIQYLEVLTILEK